MLFIYQDARGAITRRSIPKPSDNGSYITGYCEYSKGNRTFRKDRIIQFFRNQSDLSDFEKAPLPDPFQRHRYKPKPVTKKNYIFVICFTGFSSQHKAGLTNSALNHKFKVVKSVTKDLDFLCTGINAGPKKMEKAEEQGVTLITEDEFHDLAYDGLLPEGWQLQDEGENRTLGTYIQNPEELFKDWAYVIKKAHWPALGIVDAYPIDKKKTARLREKWEVRNPRYSELKPVFFRQKIKKIKHHHDYEEWEKLKKARANKKITYHTYRQLDISQYEFHEGDVFKLKDNPKKGVQVLDATDSIKAITFIAGESSSAPEEYTRQDFVNMLKTGIDPKGENSSS